MEPFKETILIFAALIKRAELGLKKLVEKVDNWKQELEGKIEAVAEQARNDRQELIDIIQAIPPPEKVTEEELTALITHLIPAPLKGDAYVLTQADKKQIAGLITVPVVTKEIETIIKTETIKEQPIVNTQIKENPFDPTEILKEIDDLKKELEKEKNRPRALLGGGRMRDMWLSYSTLDETLFGTIGGGNKTFTFGTNIISDSELIFADGAGPLVKNTEYTIVGKQVILNVEPAQQVTMKAQKL